MKRSQTSDSSSRPWYKEIGIISALIVFALSSLYLGVGPVPVGLAILTAILASSILIVPPFHYAVHEFLGKRTKRITLEGPRIVFPFIENVFLVSRELKSISFEAVFTSEDEQEIKIRGQMQYRADPNVANAEGHNLHVEISEDILKDGINEAIESKVGALGGLKELIEFIRNRNAIEDFLNCSFRLKEPPHLNHDPTTCGVPECNLPCRINACNIPNYYNLHHREVKIQLDRDHENTSDRSSIESRYGIDVVSLPLGTISFSEETKKSMEKKKQVVLRETAFESKINMIKRAREAGAEFQEAANAADCALEPEIARNKKIISMEGGLGVLGAILTNLTGDTNQGKGQKKKGGS